MIPFVCVTIGALIMVHNIYRYFFLAKQLSGLHTKKKRSLRIVLVLYIVLLFFFLLGYILISIELFLYNQAISNALVGLILFCGSIFVYIGLVLQNFMARTIQHSNLEMTQVLISAVEARDPNLNGHSIHVARLAMLLYDYLPRERQRKIRADDLEYAALLHDIGKLGVPERVLNKKGPLNEEEWHEIIRHPQIGAKILGGLDSFAEMAHWVYSHHERIDGKGYFGLPAHEIPYPALMIAVADTYSAITMQRSYREAKTDLHACEILCECRGTQLDAELVDLFLSIPREKVIACMPNEKILKAAVAALE